MLNTELTRNMRIYSSQIRTTWMIWMEGRAFFFVLAFGWMVPSLIALFIWSTAAEGKALGGMTQGEFVAYYLLFTLVNQLTLSQLYHTVGDGIRSGSWSTSLLRPISPILGTITTEIGSKAVYLLVALPVAIVLALLLHPVLHPSLLQALLFLPTLLLAWFLRFYWNYWLNLLTLWTQRADMIIAIQDALTFLFAGAAAPIILLPGYLQPWAHILPFRYMISFPVELLTGHLSNSEIATGLLIQIGWSLLSWVLTRIVWKRGIHHYSAIGG